MKTAKEMIITKKTDWLLEVKKVYVYRIFRNGNGDYTIEVQRRKDFEKINLDGSALMTYSPEIFSRLTVDYINKMFKILRKEAKLA